jgi:hypothetical protein
MSEARPKEKSLQTLTKEAPVMEARRSIEVNLLRNIRESERSVEAAPNLKVVLKLYIGAAPEMKNLLRLTKEAQVMEEYWGITEAERN